MSNMEIGAHSASKDPRHLLLPDPERQVTWLHDKYIPIIGGFLGWGGFAFQNFMSQMPIHAGIWRHILAVGVLVPLGMVYHEHREKRLAEYDALLRWYIDEHPEEFPAPVRVKVGETFKTWIPIR